MQPANGGTPLGSPLVLLFDWSTGKQQHSLVLGEKPDCLVHDLLLHQDDFVMAVTSGTPGKGRLVLGNANNVAVTFTVGATNYSLRAGQGAKDYAQAVNQSLAPGTYNVVIRIPGQPHQTEKIELAEGSTWGIIALPMGGCLPVQLY